MNFLFISFIATLFLMTFVVNAKPTEEIPEKICKLPPVRGFCRALLLRWRYNPETKHCEEFFYGGCGGNANNFKTQTECLAKCEGNSL